MLQFPSTYATTAPDRLAVAVGATGAALTYGELEARSNRVAHVLRAEGLGVGDHVAMLLENRTEFFEVMWAGLRAGIHVTPINWHLNPAEVAYIVNDCGAALLFGSSELLAHLGDDVDAPAGAAHRRGRPDAPACATTRPCSPPARPSPSPTSARAPTCSIRRARPGVRRASSRRTSGARSASPTPSSG